MVTLQEIIQDREDEEDKENVFCSIKVYRSDFKFINFVAKRLRQPRVRIVQFMTSLLALAILKPDQVYNLYYNLYQEIIKELGGHE